MEWPVPADTPRHLNPPALERIASLIVPKHFQTLMDLTPPPAEVLTRPPPKSQLPLAAKVPPSLMAIAAGPVRSISATQAIRLTARLT